LLNGGPAMVAERKGTSLSNVIANISIVFECLFLVNKWLWFYFLSSKKFYMLRLVLFYY
jgi:hypothetical protein